MGTTRAKNQIKRTHIRGEFITGNRSGQSLKLKGWEHSTAVQTPGSRQGICLGVQIEKRPMMNYVKFNSIT